MENELQAPPEPMTTGRCLNPLAMAAHLARHGDLLRQFTGREVMVRYRGSYLGILWSFFTPLLMLAVYTFVFSVIFTGSRYAAPSGTAADAAAPAVPPLHTGEFAMVLFCGLIVFNVFSETLMRAPTLVASNPNYVKKVIFPLEILPLAILFSNLIHAAVSLLILILGLAVFIHHIPLEAFYLPLALIPLVMLTAGMSWAAASLGVFFRDLSQFIAVAVQLLMFMTPIFYSIDMIPGRFQWIFRLNPLALIVEDSRRAMIWGLPPDWPAWGILTVFSFLVMLGGFAWFMKTKPWFADVV